MYTKNDYIAVFDSGVGGISVLRQLRKLMPQERYVYFGDSANAPYGSLPTERVLELTIAAAKTVYDDAMSTIAHLMRSTDFAFRTV